MSNELFYFFLVLNPKMVYSGQKPTIDVNVNTAATAITTQPKAPWITSVENNTTNKIDTTTRMILSKEPMFDFIIVNMLNC